MEQDKTKKLLETGKSTYLPVYAQKEMILDYGKGARLWDLADKEYIDLGAGIAVSVLGHQNPELVQVATEQLGKLWHTSNIYFTEPAIQLASDLVDATFADRVFFSNSGAEANEAAIKLARKFASSHASSEKHEIITFEGSFHGRTLTTITATAQPKYQEGFGPLPEGFTYCPFNDFEAIEQKISDKTCAILLEPIQGEGGVHVARPGFLAHLQALCQKHEALLIFDEIQSGMGRTGRLLAYEWEENIQPDIVTVAKALGGGLPIGAMLATERVAQTMKVGDHGSTFGGNPVIAAVACAILKQVCSSALMDNVNKQSEKLQAALSDLKEQKQLFKEIRGRGLIVGAELQGAWEGRAADLSEVCLQHGLLILQAGPNVLRFLPPLNITDEELEEGLQRMKSALNHV
ncbi:MAG: aspartate aminotransferase family protein [SAR324 cluster bacterium]|nr:aspartate aminotransferase family protein [SAR324 cluster bacterium]